MKICIAQLKSAKGQVQTNIEKHLEFVKTAIRKQAGLILFPELSITNYEPELARQLATDFDDPIFNPFQELADRHMITIGIGMPLKVHDGITISILIFQPLKRRSVFSKRTLHEDEVPYFVSGNHQPILQVKGKRIALGICYETMHRQHFVTAKANEAELYIASVAKKDSGVEKSGIHFPEMAKEFGMPILMSNAVGPADNFVNHGKSAVWNKKGDRIAQLNHLNQGILIYSTDTEQVEQHAILEH